MMQAFVIKLGCVLCLAGRAVVADAAPPDISLLAQDVAFADARFSPDGKLLAVHRIEERGNSLLILDTAKLEVKSQLSFDAHSHVQSFVWKNDETIVLARAMRPKAAAAGTPVGTGEVYAVSVDGKRQKLLFGAGSGEPVRSGGLFEVGWIIDSLDGEPNHVLVGVNRINGFGYPSGLPSLVKIDIRSGKQTQLGEAPVARPLIEVDRVGAVRFATGYDSDGTLGFYRFDAEQPSWARVDTGLGEHGRFVPLGFNADGTELFATISEQGEPSCLHRVTAVGMQRTKLTCEAELDPGRLIWSRERGVPLGLLYSVTGPRMHLLARDSVDAQLFKALSQHHAPLEVVFSEFSGDQRWLTYWVRGDRDPGRLYLRDLAAGTDRLVFEVHPEIDRNQLAASHPITLNARDGVKLHGFVTLPNGVQPRNLPLVVMPNSALFAGQESWLFDAETQLFATRGYAVLTLNTRGASGFGDAFQRMAYGQVGLSPQDDLIDAIRWAIDTGVADPQRVCLVGTRHGAYSAMVVTAREPDLVRCAVGLSGVYDLPALLGEGAPGRAPEARRVFERVLGTDHESLRQRSPTSQAAQIRAAIWLVHGELDDYARLSQAEAFHEALKKAGVSSEIWVVDRAGRYLSRTKDRVEYYERLLAFVSKHLAVSPTSHQQAASETHSATP